MRMPMRRLYRSVAPDYSLIRQKGTGVGAFGAKITGKHHVGFAERIVQCVNAMEGLEDPCVDVAKLHDSKATAILEARHLRETIDKIKRNRLSGEMHVLSLQEEIEHLKNTIAEMREALGTIVTHSVQAEDDETYSQTLNHLISDMIVIAKAAIAKEA